LAKKEKRPKRKNRAQCAKGKGKHYFRERIEYAERHGVVQKECSRACRSSSVSRRETHSILPAPC